MRGSSGVEARASSAQLAPATAAAATTARARVEMQSASGARARVLLGECDADSPGRMSAARRDAARLTCYFEASLANASATLVSSHGKP